MGEFALVLGLRTIARIQKREAKKEKVTHRIRLKSPTSSRSPHGPRNYRWPGRCVLGNYWSTADDVKGELRVILLTCSLQSVWRINAKESYAYLARNTVQIVHLCCALWLDRPRPWQARSGGRPEDPYVGQRRISFADARIRLRIFSEFKAVPCRLRPLAGGRAGCERNRLPRRRHDDAIGAFKMGLRSLRPAT
jgi:hypothetical protein